MSLTNKLKTVKGDLNALIVDDISLTYDDIMEKTYLIDKEALKPNLVIHTDSLLDAIPTILAADGAAKKIGLFSPDLHFSDLLDIISPMGASSILTHTCGLNGKSTSEGFYFNSIKDILLPSERTNSSSNLITTNWILTSSGTTGKPKLVQHTLESLTRTTQTKPSKGAGQIWGLLYDFTRFAGFQVVLQSLLSGATLVAPNLKHGLADALDKLFNSGCTHLSATPTLWRKILLLPESQHLNLRQITIGGEIVDRRLLIALASAYPNARITHIYASTEAGVGFSVKDGKPGFPLSYLDSPPNEIRIKIKNDRLWILNSHVSDCYLGGEGKFGKAGWVDTGDNVCIEGDRIIFLGRASGIINVGGNKFYPEQVEDCLLQHPQIEMAHVFSKPNPITGALAAAEIVTKDDNLDMSTADIVKYLSQKLPKHMIPFFITFVDKLSTNIAGKIERNSK